MISIQEKLVKIKAFVLELDLYIRQKSSNFNDFLV